VGHAVVRQADDRVFPAAPPKGAQRGGPHLTRSGERCGPHAAARGCRGRGMAGRRAVSTHRRGNPPCG
jgi:hypothetical protein